MNLHRVAPNERNALPREFRRSRLVTHPLTLLNKLFLFLTLSLLLGSNAIAADYLLYTGNTGAQTQIDQNHKTTWTISVATAPVGAQFWGAKLSMKRGSSTSADISLNFYRGTNASGTFLGGVTLTSSSFSQSGFPVVDFQLATKINIESSTTYYVELVSTAPDSQSQAYFIKGLKTGKIYDLANIANNGNASGSGETWATTTASPITDVVKALFSATRSGASQTLAGYQARSGDVLRYRISVTESTDIGQTTTLTETIPANTTYTGSGEGWSCTANTALSTCTQSVTVAANSGGTAVTKDFTVTVGNSLGGVASITNTVATSVGTCSSCSVVTNVEPVATPTPTPTPVPTSTLGSAHIWR